MHTFDVLGDPVRRRILELLAGGERASGAVAEVIQAEFEVSPSAVSQQLKVLRESATECQFFAASRKPSSAR